MIGHNREKKDKSHNILKKIKMTHWARTAI